MNDTKNKLHLSNFPSDELVEVRNLVNLEELIILGNSAFNINIYELCCRLKKLERLQIKTMRLTAPKEFEGVPCPALRVLNLCDINGSKRAILNWILRHAETLEILDLYLQFAVSKPNTVIIKILSKCKNLRSFSMPMFKLNSNLAHRLIKIVSENGVTSVEHPLKLNVQSIHDRIQKEMVNTSAKQLITLPT